MSGEHFRYGEMISLIEQVLEELGACGDPLKDHLLKVPTEDVVSRIMLSGKFKPFPPRTLVEYDRDGQRLEVPEPTFDQDVEIGLFMEKHAKMWPLNMFATYDGHKGGQKGRTNYDYSWMIPVGPEDPRHHSHKAGRKRGS